jgi:hypothetical protein
MGEDKEYIYSKLIRRFECIEQLWRFIFFCGFARHNMIRKNAINAKTMTGWGSRRSCCRADAGITSILFCFIFSLLLMKPPLVVHNGWMDFQLNGSSRGFLSFDYTYTLNPLNQPMVDGLFGCSFALFPLWVLTWSNFRRLILAFRSFVNRFDIVVSLDFLLLLLNMVMAYDRYWIFCCIVELRQKCVHQHNKQTCSCMHIFTSFWSITENKG